jgi:hypothetical protein
MQNIRISLQGQMINFDQFVAYNNKTRAVGNMNVNARGDVIDSAGNIIQTRTAMIKQKFTGTTVSKKNKAIRSKVQRPLRPERSLEEETDDYVDSSDYQVEQDTSTNISNNIRSLSELSQEERVQVFGPRSTSLRGVLASDIDIDLNEVTRPSDVRTLRRI